MTHAEYSELFHRSKAHLVAFKLVYHCDDELRKMVEMAVEAEREACAQAGKEALKLHASLGVVVENAIRARGDE